MKRKILSVLLLLALFLTACGKSGPSFQEQYDLGVKYLSEGSYAEAIIAFTAAIEIDEKQAAAYTGRGRAYALSGDTEENLSAALTDFEKAVELDDTMADAYLGLADVYIRMGQYDKALEVLKAALGKTGSDQGIADKIAEIESGNISDSSGNTRLTSLYDGNGALKSAFAYTYDERGRKTGETSFDGTMTQVSHVDILYDEQGNCIQDSGGVGADNIGLMRVMNQYGQSGNVTRAEWYEADGTLDSIWTYEYDADGNNTRINEFDGDGTLREYEIWEYSAVGNVVSDTAYNADGSKDSWIIYEYGADGLRNREIHYRGDGTVFYSRVIEHDAAGNTTKLLDYDDEGNLTRYDVMEYNDGRCIARTVYDAAGNVTHRAEYN